MMRVAYPMRVDALDKPGGDVEQIRTYMRMCKSIARLRGYVFEGEILTELDPDLSGFDVVHLTNLDRPVDLYSQFLAVQRAARPVVLTPLHHSYREIERYERNGRGGLVGTVSGRLGFYRLEAARILVKSRRYPQLRGALWKALRKGIRKAQMEVLEGCDRVLVLSDKENADIAIEITSIAPSRVVKLRNGFQPAVADAVQRDLEITVIARLESRKNQIAILEALEILGLKATFIGPPNPNHRRYCELFRAKIASSLSTYIPGVPAQDVASILARSRVHVAAGWFEVASLVDLEAYAQGCRVVASLCGGTREVLGDDAYYVDPGSSTDLADKIAAAVRSARAGEQNPMNGFLQASPTWEATCAALLDLYSSLAGVNS